MDILENIEFAYPHFLWGLLLLPVLYWFRRRSQSKKQPVFRISRLASIQSFPAGKRIFILKALPWLRMLCLALLIVAMARPQSKDENETISTEGIDIISVMDVSASMLANDFNPNRLEAAKAVLADFVQQRPNDRIGLVIFAGESFSLCPATTDHAVLLSLLKEVQSGDGLLQDGTAIGMGLASGVDRLRESRAKSRVIILLTDGVNNRGAIDPITATEIAKKYGIRVYTIGVGSDAKDVNMDLFGRQFVNLELDEKLLTKISGETGGQYFRAKDASKLKKIYEVIDKLEKSRMEQSAFHRKAEEFYPWVMAALALLLLELFLRYAVVKASP